MDSKIKRFDKPKDFLDGEWHLYDLELKSINDSKPRHMVITYDPSYNEIISTALYSSLSNGFRNAQTVYKVFTGFKVDTSSVPLASLFVEDGTYWRSGFFNHKYVTKYMLVPVVMDFSTISSYSTLDMSITPDELNIIQSIKDGVAAKGE